MYQSFMADVACCNISLQLFLLSTNSLVPILTSPDFLITFCRMSFAFLILPVDLEAPEGLGIKVTLCLVKKSLTTLLSKC